MALKMIAKKLLEAPVVAPPRAHYLAALGILLVLPVSTHGALVRENTWITDGTVYATASAGNVIYLGGQFTHVGPATGAAAELNNLTALPSAPYLRVNGIVRAVVHDGSGGWYLGGLFSSVQGQPRANLAHVDAEGILTSWNPGTDGEVNAIAIHGTTVFVGGLFTTVAGQSRSNAARIDAAGSAMLWNPMPNGRVRSIGTTTTYVWLMGDFTALGSDPYAHLAQIHAESGTPTGWGLGTTTYVFDAMMVLDGKLYASVHLPGFPVYEILIWDAVTGNLLPNRPSVDGRVTAFGSDPLWLVVYIAGEFQNVGGLPRPRLAAFTRNTFAVQDWHPISSLDGPIHSLTSNGSKLFIGGEFSQVNGGSKRNLIAISFPVGDPLGGVVDDTWTPDPSGPVYAVAWKAVKMMAGGDFGTVGAVKRSNLAAIDATSGSLLDWSPTANARVEALTVSGSTVYVGGQFSDINGVPRNRAASVDAQSGSISSFNPNVNVDFPTSVRAFAIYGTTVYMAGAFSTVGGASRVGLAAVNATTGAVLPWNPGANGAVYALRIIAPIDIFAAPTIVVGGQFTSVGGQSRNNLASLDGGTGLAKPWNPNANGYVLSLIALSNFNGGISKVYAGGAFSTVGGQPRSCIAAIDGAGLPTTWAPNANGVVSSIATFGSTVFVGGGFTSIGGQPRNHIAAVDATTGLATSWDPNAAGGSPAGHVYALLKRGSTTYAGGSFTTIAGTRQSYFAGILDESITGVDSDPAPDVSILRLRAAPNPFEGSTNVQFSLVSEGETRVDVYDVTGRLIRRLHTGWLPSGGHKMPWDGRDDSGRLVATGIYFLGVKSQAGEMGSKVYRLK